MIGLGREPKELSDLFYVCGLIDYISRETKNRRKVVVNQLGKELITKVYDLADVYHSDQIQWVSEDLIEKAGIQTGEFDNVADCRYSIPTYWEIGKVYKRLIQRVAQSLNISLIDALFLVYNSFLSPKIDDYNSTLYTENPDNLLIYFEEGRIQGVF